MGDEQAIAGAAVETVETQPVEQSEEAIESGLDAAIEEALKTEGLEFEPGKDEPEAPEKAAEAPQEARGEQPAPSAQPSPTAPEKPAGGPSRPLTEEDLAAPEEYTAEDASPRMKKNAERWERLQSGYRESRADVSRLTEKMHEATPYIERYTSMDQAFTKAGMTGEQLRGALDLAYAINSGDLASARQMLQHQMRLIDAHVGEVGPGSPDPVAAHADLRQAVEAGDMTEEWAQKLALQRTREGVAQHALQQQGHQQRAQQEHAAYAEAVNQAGADLDAIDAYLLKTDPQYAVMRAPLHHLVAQLTQNGTAPDQFVPIVTRQYHAMKQAMASRAPGAVPGPRQQLMRPNGTGVATGAPAPMRDPTSALEAVDRALAEAGLQ